MKSPSLEENDINGSKIIVLGCTKNHVPFVKQSRVGGLLGQPVRPLQSIFTRCLTSPARLKSLTWHVAQKWSMLIHVSVSSAVPARFAERSAYSSTCVHETFQRQQKLRAWSGTIKRIALLVSVLKTRGVVGVNGEGGYLGHRIAGFRVVPYMINL